MGFWSAGTRNRAQTSLDGPWEARRSRGRSNDPRRGATRSAPGAICDLGPPARPAATSTPRSGRRASQRLAECESPPGVHDDEVLCRHALLWRRLATLLEHPPCALKSSSRSGRRRHGRGSRRRSVLHTSRSRRAQARRASARPPSHPRTAALRTSKPNVSKDGKVHAMLDAASAGQPTSACERNGLNAGS